MKNIILIYIIVQLVTTAYGLAVIESARPFVEKKLIDEGYQKNKNSMYIFNNTFSNILKAFIPGYYLVKALKIIRSKGNISKQVLEQINNKNFVLPKEEKIIESDVQVIKDTKKEDLVNNLKIEFEKPEKYTARKNDINYYDTYETPIQYITVEDTKEESLELSPFIDNSKEIQEVYVKEEVTNRDIAKAICDLNLYELKSLKEKIVSLENIKKKEKSLKLEKDVA